MSKIKVLYRVSKKATKKVLTGDISYRGKKIYHLPKLVISHTRKAGVKATLRLTKQELLRIDRHLGSTLVFPNGLVSGVDGGAIDAWYKKHARPITIVIPSYNDLDVLVPCLESIAATTDPELAKVIVVDDYCQPKHREQLAKLENEQVHIVYRDKNGGFAKAVNTGLKAADPKHDVVLINSDIVAHPDWLEALQYGAYEFGVDTGIVGPKLLYPDGRIQSAGSHRNTESPQWFDHYYRFQDANYGPANIPQYCIGVTGACMYVKREFLEYVGILDDDFQFAFEDADWCLRGWEAGYRTLYFPAATLTHVESATRSKNKAITDKEKQSIDHFWGKWGDWFDKRNVQNDKGQTRIIFVLQTLGLSGGIKIVFEHANRLSQRGFATEIWGLDGHSSPWEIADGVKVRTFKNYERLINALTPQEAIKVATWWETAFPVWLSSVRKGRPVYFIQEFETWFYPDDLLAQAAVVACYRKEFTNLTTSQYNLQEIQNLGLLATAIPCGYDNHTFKVLPKVQRKSDMILAVGRTFFQKNFLMTLAGWQKLGENRPTLQLFGFEPEMQKLDPKIAYLTKPDNERVNELYNEATVFVQTSRHEGFSLPILEAMAGGAPIICTDAHGNRDFCENGKNCLMVEQDDAAGLAGAFRKLLNDAKLRERLSAAGVRTAKRYQWDVITDKIEMFYKQVAKAK